MKTTLLCILTAAALHAAPAVTAIETQQVHPLLIRNAHNELLQLVISVTGPEPVRLHSVACTLTGDDIAHDAESVELLNATGLPFGSPTPPAARLSFRADQPLSPGDNTYLLSARLRPQASLSHHLAGSCQSIVTSAGLVTPQAGAPVNHRIGIALRRHGDDGVHTYRIPSIATSPRGTLLTVYDMRRQSSHDLQGDIDIGLSRSTDGGQTWEATRVIMDMGEYGGLPQDQNGCSDPGILVDQKSGEVFVFALWVNGKPGKHQWTGDGSEPGFEMGKTAQLMLVRSKDDGVTWSQPENLTRKLKKPEWYLFAVAPQQGINLADGTLVMPMQGRDENGTPFATIMSSADHGATWIVASPAYSGGNECQAAQLSDGSIMLNIRNGGLGYRAVYVTTDLGRTWKAHPTSGNTLIEPTCNASLYAVPSGPSRILLFANPHDKKERVNQTIQVSLDDGVTWPERYHLLLDEGRGNGYPSLTRIGSNEIGIVYEGSQADLVFEKIPLPELLRRPKRK